MAPPPPLASQAAAPARGGSASTKATEFFELHNKLAFDAAAELFHFPGDYPESERTADKVAIGRWLSVLAAELGKVQGFNVPEGGGGYLMTSMGSGPEAYWAEQAEDPPTILYEVEFERDGKGYVQLQFHA